MGKQAGGWLRGELSKALPSRTLWDLGAFGGVSQAQTEAVGQSWGHSSAGGMRAGMAEAVLTARLAASALR